MRELVFDAWTALTFKRQFGPRKTPGSGWLAPTWVGDDHHRRLLAYKVLQSYIDNAAREFLDTTDDKQKNEHREYGDAAVLRSAALSALLGESQTITVDGAVEDEEDKDLTAEERAEAERALRQQEWFESWSDDERLLVKLQECERNAVGLGDGVYVLGWSEQKQRPRLRIFDPGFYFPVLDDGNEDEFPQRVHIAWEIDDPNSTDGKVRVRRLTWELERLEEPRSVPYQDEPAEYTCLFTDAVWTLENDVRGIDDLRGSSAVYQENEDGEEANRLDLGIDFIPVVHISNTVAIAEHYGESVLSKVAQILDDISNTDTDLAAAAGTTGTPPIALSGATLAEGSLKYGPGTVFTVGDGRMDVLDTSKSLDALLKYLDELMDRLSVNGRMPAALLGRVDPSDVPSGIAIALSFGPLSAMVREMRLARKEKYQLLFKFVHRLAVAGGISEEELPREHATTDFEFGSFLPNDEAAAVTLTSTLLAAKAISLEQAVMILRTAGITERDQQAEVEAIQSRDFEGANQLLDATGDQAAVNEYLGRGTVVNPPPPPGGGIPPTPGTPPPPQPGIEPSLPETQL